MELSPPTSPVRDRRAGASRTRPAFSLIELLVVIGIIGILAALTAVGVSKVVSGQRVSNTKGAIQTIQKTLNDHLAYVVAEAKKETGLTQAYHQMDFLFGQDQSGGERNRVIWIKMRIMEAFPISYAEVNNPYPYSSNIIPVNMRKYNATYAQIVRGRQADNTKDAKGNPLHLTESSACLLMALSIARNGAALNVDNLGSSIADTDGVKDGLPPDGIPELVDSWGNALTFFRFPTDNQALQASNPASGNAKTAVYGDPEDPGGALFKMPMQTGRKTFESHVHKIASPFNPNAACYIVPTIVSAGPDGVLNLNQYMNIINPKIDDDNIYSFQLR